eukprot:4027219-Pleurochrysis_carterae.AAC.4
MAPICLQGLWLISPSLSGPQALVQTADIDKALAKYNDVSTEAPHDQRTFHQSEQRKAPK